MLCRPSEVTLQLQLRVDGGELLELGYPATQPCDTTRCGMRSNKTGNCQPHSLTYIAAQANLNGSYLEGTVAVVLFITPLSPFEPTDRFSRNSV